MYIAKSVIMALNTIMMVEGMIPARAKAIGSVSTPPPQTVATRLNMAERGEVLRNSESYSGLSDSRLGCLAMISSLDGQNVDPRLRSGSNERDL